MSRLLNPPARKPRVIGLTKTVVAPNGEIAIPGWVVDFASFRRWLHSTEFPEYGKICFINNRVWADLTMEEFFDHGQLGNEISAVLYTLMNKTQFGYFARENTRYSHLETNLSTEPDGLVFSHEALDSGRVDIISGKMGKYTEVIGSPEIAIEMISRSSKVKDKDWLMSAYFEAGVKEYWLFDAQDEDAVVFDIFTRNKKGFVMTDKLNGWVKSLVLGKSFRLLRLKDIRGKSKFTLKVRSSI
jgi:Uma2 family endonuclease